MDTRVITCLLCGNKEFSETENRTHFRQIHQITTPDEIYEKSIVRVI